MSAFVNDTIQDDEFSRGPNFPTTLLTQKLPIFSLEVQFPGIPSGLIIFAALIER